MPTLLIRRHGHISSRNGRQHYPIRAAASLEEDREFSSDRSLDPHRPHQVRSVRQEPGRVEPGRRKKQWGWGGGGGPKLGALQGVNTRGLEGWGEQDTGPCGPQSNRMSGNGGKGLELMKQWSGGGQKITKEPSPRTARSFSPNVWWHLVLGQGR